MRTTPTSPPTGGADRVATRHHVAVRLARPDDLPRLTGLVERCSAQTLHRRFHGATGRPVARELLRVTAPTDAHRSWVAVSGDGAVRGMATLARGREGELELAVLVEDAWFRRGVGRRLIGRLAAHATEVGEIAIVAWVQADNTPALRFLRAVVPGARPAFAEGEVVVRIAVGSAAVAATADVVPADVVAAASAPAAAAGAGAVDVGVVGARVVGVGHEAA